MWFFCRRFWEERMSIYMYGWTLNLTIFALRCLNIYDTKPGLKTNVQNCYCDNCFVSFPQSLHYHFLWQWYCFLNAGITPRKTNASPKIITYTRSLWQSSLAAATTSDPTPSFIYYRWTKTTCPMSLSDNSSPWYNSGDIHKCPLNKQEPSVSVASSISVLIGDRQTRAYWNNMEELN